MRIALAVSLAVNLGFAARFAIFEPNILVRPLCWKNHVGLVAIEGERTYRYMDAFSGVRGPFETRLDADGNYYVSLLDYWSEQDYFWNQTMKIVNSLVWEYGDEITLPPYKVEGPDNINVTCELTRAVAIVPSSDQ